MDTGDKVPVLRDGEVGERRSDTSCRRFLITPVILFFFLSIGMDSYLVPEYIHERVDQDHAETNTETATGNYTYNVCLSNQSGPEYEHYKYVQKETAKWQNYLSVARVTPAIFTTLVWASFSDVLGRRMLIVLSISGYVAKLLAFTLVVHFRTHLVYLIVGEILEGITGTFTTFLAVTFAFISDVTDSGSERTLAIILIELLLGIIFAIASLATGYYIKYVGYYAPALTALGLALASIVVTMLFLPETLRERKRGGFRHLISSISTAFRLYFKPESKIVQLKYFLLLLGFIVYAIQSLNRGSLETLYQLGKPFCWSSTKIGWYGAMRVALLSLFGMGGVVLLKKVFADDTIAVFSCAVTVVSYIVEGLAKTEIVLYTVPVLGTLSLIPIPMIRSLMSHLTPPDKQGAMFSTIGSFETLCSMIGTLTSNVVYSATLSILNGFVFLILALITAISGVILSVFMCVQRCRSTEKDSDIQEHVVS